MLLMGSTNFRWYQMSEEEFKKMEAYYKSLNEQGGVKPCKIAEPDCEACQ